ncbi:hypothetical protein [Lacipirellula limnantheis]|nr:hypothetical protein [Lacipirellula limnantheis]
MRQLKAFFERSKVARDIVTVANVVLPPILLIAVTCWVYSYMELVYVKGNIGHYHLQSKSGIGQLWLAVYDTRYPEQPYSPQAVEKGWHAGAFDLHAGTVQAIQNQCKRGLFKFEVGQYRSRPIDLKMPLSSIVVPLILMFAVVRSVPSGFSIRSLLALLTISALLFGTIASISE